MSNITKKIKHSAPTLLACGAAISTIGGLIFAVKGTIKAVRAVDEMKKNGEPITKKAVIKKVIPYYIPAIGFSATAITCIFSSNTVSVKRNKVLNEKNKELMQMCLQAGQVVSTVTKDKADAIEEIKKKVSGKVDKETLEEIDSTVVPPITDDEEVIIFDTCTSSVFRTTYKRFKNAEMALNSRLYENNVASGRVTLGQLHEQMGGERDYISDGYCWDQYVLANEWDSCFVYFQEYPALAKDGTRMIILRYTIPPVSIEEANIGF